ncbi:cation:proton antiporter, partial [Candidatus Micrarchaeota archaeon]|nr:cation:proton antiporter [Candidatus Micrarchaeota archaeon]
AMIVPLITRLNVKEEVGILLSLESVITDVFCIAGAVVLIELIVTNSFNPSDIIQTLSGTFSTAILAGFAGGLFWINVLKRLSGKPLGYMLTLAVLLVLYSAIELVGGSGAIGVLIFSLVLGNSVEIAKTLRMSGDYSLEKSIKSTQTEIAFFVKTFFFVFLGLIINPSILEVNALAIAVGLLVVLIIARYLGTMILAFVNPLYVQYKKLVTLMMSRGLAAAVLAFLPLNQNPPIVIPYFSEVVFLIIIFTSLLTTFGSYTTRDKEAETVDETPKVISTKRPRISRVD